MDDATFRQLADEGKISDESRVRKGEVGHWFAAREVKGLFRWCLRATDGKVYGPVSRKELDGWKSHRRVAAGCEISSDGGQSWRPAAEVYPDLATPQPASTARPTPQPQPLREASLPPTAQVEGVVSALTQALDLRKLGLFLAGSLVLGICLCLVLALGAASKNLAVFLLLSLLALPLAIGLSGVLAGGVARLAHLDGQGQPGTIGEAIGFCRQRFLSLFGGTLLMVFVVLLASVLLNGFVALLNNSRTIGSLLGALLFVPQMLLNLVLFVAFLTIVLVPAAIAVDDVSVGPAFGRVIGCLRHHVRELTVQIGVAMFFGSIVVGLLASLLAAALLPTMSTNGPDVAGGLMRTILPDFSGLSRSDDSSPFNFGAMMDPPRPGATSRSRAGAIPGGPNRLLEMRQSKGPWGDWLRWLWLLTVFAAWIAYPVVFWICAFTRLYGSLSPSLAARSARAAFPQPLPVGPPA